MWSAKRLISAILAANFLAVDALLPISAAMAQTAPNQGGGILGGILRPIDGLLPGNQGGGGGGGVLPGFPGQGGGNGGGLFPGGVIPGVGGGGGNAGGGNADGPGAGNPDVNSGGGSAQGDNPQDPTLGEQESGPVSDFKTGLAAGQFNPKWKNYPSGAGTIRIPGDNWTTISVVNNTRVSGYSVESEAAKRKGQAAGFRSMVTNDEVAGSLGLTSDQIVNAVSRYASTPPMVFVRYTPQTGQLRVSAIRVVRRPDRTIEVQQADYTPHHGEIIKAHQFFTTPGERLSGTGYNPFERFRGDDTDPVFYNVGSGAAQVVAGWAVGHFRASGGLFVEAKLRLDQQTKKGGGWLRRKITTTTTYYAQPKFYSIQPYQASAQRGVQSPGITSNICVTGADSCGSADHVMYSGVILDEMSGGNMPDAEAMMGAPEVETKRSWTILAYALLTAALVYTGGALIAGEASWAFVQGVGPVGASQLSVAQAAVAAGGVQSAAIAGASYAAGSYIFGEERNGLTAPQRSYAGRVQVNPAQVGSGFVTPPECKNKYCRELGNRANQLQVANVLVNKDSGEVNGLPGVQSTVGGNCPAGMSVRECALQSKFTGVAPRSDSYVETNSVTLARQRKSDCSLDFPNSESPEYLKCISAEGVLQFDANAAPKILPGVLPVGGGGQAGGNGGGLGGGLGGLLPGLR